MAQAMSTQETLKRIRSLLPDNLGPLWLEYAVAEYILHLAVRLQDAQTLEHVNKIKKEWDA